MDNIDLIVINKWKKWGTLNLYIYGSQVWAEVGFIQQKMQFSEWNPFFFFFFFLNHVLTDLHTLFVTYLVINRNCFLFLHG